MAWTDWHSPRALALWTDTGIEFSDGTEPLDRTGNLITLEPLIGTTRNNTVLQSGSRGLIFTDFGFSINSARSVAVEILATRLARVVDDRVQLWQGSAVGANVATATTEDLRVYSGAMDDFWRTAVDPSRADFGLLLDLAPRPDMPSNTRPIVRSVRIRIEY